MNTSFKQDARYTCDYCYICGGPSMYYFKYYSEPGDRRWDGLILGACERHHIIYKDEKYVEVSTDEAHVFQIMVES